MKFFKLDWWLLVILLILAGASLISIYSIQTNLFYYQLLWFCLGFLIILITSQINWRWFATRKWFIFSFYGLAIFLLIVVLFFNQPIRGARSWLVLGFFRFQPSELVKVVLIMIYASFFARRHLEASVTRNIVVSFFYFLLPAILVFLQPNLGTALIFFGIWFGFLIVSGLKWPRFLAGIIILFLIFSLLWLFFLKSYQKERVSSFFFPSKNLLGANYNVSQSKIAIGSAGFFGKGFRQGTQIQLGFLPEAQTDFIFSAFIEEWGLVGGLLLLFAFLTFIFRIIKIGLKADNNWAKFVCLGVVISFGLQFFLNIGSCLGLSPVVGTTFPFFSYGGSSLLTSALLIGIIQYIAIGSPF